jgi:hypothetical protein
MSTSVHIFTYIWVQIYSLHVSNIFIYVDMWINSCIYIYRSYMCIDTWMYIKICVYVSGFSICIDQSFYNLMFLWMSRNIIGCFVLYNSQMYPLDRFLMTKYSCRNIVIILTLLWLRLFLTAPVLVLIIFKITRTRVLRAQDLWFLVVFIKSWILRIQVLVILDIIGTKTSAVRNGLMLSWLTWMMIDFMHWNNVILHILKIRIYM